jgi:hypothetical protein
MQLVNDEIFEQSLEKVLQSISIKKNPTCYKKKILINLMPLFALKQLVIFIKLGEFLKKEGFFVDYFSCNRFFNHCDMVKINDEVDKDLLCERCEFVEEKLGFNYVKQLAQNYKYNSIYDIFLNNSMKRCCGNKIKFKKYMKESQNNLELSERLILDYDFFISLDHFQNYSLAPMFEKIDENRKLFIGIEQGSGNKVYLHGDNKEKIFKMNIKISSKEKEFIKNYFLKRVNLNNTIETKD